MSSSKVICPHLHIPIQSASDPILAAMKRKYRVARLEKLMEKIQKYLPDCGLGTDVIVGFPGETESLFEETVSFIERYPFTYLHVFPFSQRTGTVAERLEGQVPIEICQKRTKILRQMGRMVQATYAKKFERQALPVLFEESQEPEIYEGYTSNYIRVRVSSETNLRGKILNTRLQEIGDGYLKGTCDDS